MPWTAAGMLGAEKWFRRVKGRAELVALALTVERHLNHPQPNPVPPPRPLWSPPDTPSRRGRHRTTTTGTSSSREGSPKMRHTNSIEPKATAEGNDAVADEGLLRGTGGGFGPLFRKFPFEQRTLFHVLRHQAEQIPDKPWLIFDDTDVLTFQEGYARACQFAHAMRTVVDEPNRVALLLRNQVEFFPAFIGAIAHGSAAAPLNPELRGEILERGLTKSEAHILLVRTDLLPLLSGLRSLATIRLVVACGSGEIPDTMHGVRVTSFDRFIEDQPATPPERMPSPVDPGAIIFTSGTTGGSKAAVSSNHYLYLFSAAVSDSFAHAPEDVLTTPLQACHVAGLQVIANSALQVGCTAHMKSFFSPSRFWDDVARDGATFCMLMGQMPAILLKTVESVPTHRLAHMYSVPYPGLEFEQRFKTTIVWQGYGLTETFPHLPSKRRIENKAPTCCGFAPEWFDYGVVDQNDRLVGPGEPGELVYRPRLPHAMFSGYYKDEAATNAALRNFMFHTGDIGFYDEEGAVHYLRRMTDTIRRGGENISAVELETVAASHPAVVEAAAYAVPSELAGHEVKIDVTISGDLDLAEFHAWLAERLPRYMIPRYLEALEAMPKTPSARVEKYKLAARGVDRSEVMEFEPPRRKPREPE